MKILKIVLLLAVFTLSACSTYSTYCFDKPDITSHRYACECRELGAFCPATEYYVEGK